MPAPVRAEIQISVGFGPFAATTCGRLPPNIVSPTAGALSILLTTRTIGEPGGRWPLSRSSMASSISDRPWRR
ncbi:hypothetical protein D3C81_1623210 [compost metagenome]